jgi:hypothetical protein
VIVGIEVPVSSFVLVAVASFVVTSPAGAQAPLLKPATFPSYQLVVPDTTRPLPEPPPRTAGQRVRHAAIGGVFGAVAGVATCTILSITLFRGQGCTAKGNTQFGVGGFLLGAGIGAVL